MKAVRPSSQSPVAQSKSSDSSARERGWNGRVILDSIPSYDAARDKNCVSLAITTRNRTKLRSASKTNRKKPHLRGNSRSEGDRNTVKPEEVTDPRLAVVNQLITELQQSYRSEDVLDELSAFFIQTIKTTDLKNQVTALNKELENVRNKKSVTKQFSDAIKAREASIVTLKDFAERATSVGAGETAVDRVLVALNRHRVLTVAAVEMVAGFREYVRKVTLAERRAYRAPLLRAGINYIDKLRHDTDFLEASALRQFFEFSKRSDPFLLYPAAHGRSQGKQTLEFPVGLGGRVTYAEKILLEETFSSRDVTVKPQESEESEAQVWSSPPPLSYFLSNAQLLTEKPALKATKSEDFRDSSPENHSQFLPKPPEKPTSVPPKLTEIRKKAVNLVQSVTPNPVIPTTNMQSYTPEPTKLSHIRRMQGVSPAFRRVGAVSSVKTHESTQSYVEEKREGVGGDLYREASISLSSNGDFGGGQVRKPQETAANTLQIAEIEDEKQFDPIPNPASRLRLSRPTALQETHFPSSLQSLTPPLPSVPSEKAFVPQSLPASETFRAPVEQEKDVDATQSGEKNRKGSVQTPLMAEGKSTVLSKETEPAVKSRSEFRTVTPVKAVEVPSIAPLKTAVPEIRSIPPVKSSVTPSLSPTKPTPAISPINPVPTVKTTPAVLTVTPVKTPPASSMETHSVSPVKATLLSTVTRSIPTVQNTPEVQVKSSGETHPSTSTKKPTRNTKLAVKTDPRDAISGSILTLKQPIRMISQSPEPEALPQPVTPSSFTLDSLMLQGKHLEHYLTTFLAKVPPHISASFWSPSSLPTLLTRSFPSLITINRGSEPIGVFGFHINTQSTRSNRVDILHISAVSEELLPPVLDRCLNYVWQAFPCDEIRIQVRYLRQNDQFFLHSDLKSTLEQRHFKWQLLETDSFGDKIMTFSAKRPENAPEKPFASALFYDERLILRLGTVIKIGENELFIENNRLFSIISPLSCFHALNFPSNPSFPSSLLSKIPPKFKFPATKVKKSSDLVDLASDLVEQGLEVTAKEREKGVVAACTAVGLRFNVCDGAVLRGLEYIRVEITTGYTRKVDDFEVIYLECDDLNYPVMIIPVENEGNMGNPVDFFRKMYTEMEGSRQISPKSVTEVWLPAFNIQESSEYTGFNGLECDLGAVLQCFQTYSLSLTAPRHVFGGIPRVPGPEALVIKSGFVLGKV